MSGLLTVLVAYYLGGITTLLAAEYSGDGVQVADVMSAIAWPVTVTALIITKINEYRKGS
jgi:hypothetical protein